MLRNFPRHVAGVLALSWFGVLVASASAAQTEAGDESVTAMPHRLLHVQQGWGELGHNVAAHAPGQPAVPLQVGSQEYPKGFGHHAPGEIVVELGGEYATFETLVGVQPCPGGQGSVVFKILVDEQERFNSGVMRPDSPPKLARVDVSGGMDLRLVLTEAADGMICDLGNWINPRLVRATSSPAAPTVTLLDIAPFAEIVTSDPGRLEGSKADRVQEYRAEDIYLETPVQPNAKGEYVSPEGSPSVLGLKWMERRRVQRVGFTLAEGSARPSAEDLRMQCWVGESAWQGAWKSLRGEWDVQGDTWTIQPEWSDAAMARGGSRKVRFLFPEPVRIARFSAIAPSPLLDARLRIEFDKPLEGQPSVEIYNGQIFAPAGQPLSWDSAKPLDLQVRYAKPRSWSTDRTVLRFTLPSAAFGVAVDDVLTEGGVYVRDFGLLVLREGQTAEAFKQKIAPLQTVLREVRNLPDQTLAKVLPIVHNPAQDKTPTMLSLAADNHKFIVHRGGLVQFSSDPATDHQYVSKLLPMGGQFAPRYGSGGSEKITRGLDGGWMPIVVNTVEDGGVVYRQRTFVAPMDPQATRSVCVVEITAENPTDAVVDAAIDLTVHAEASRQDLAEFSAVPNGAIAFRHGRLLAVIQAPEAKPLKADVSPAGVKVTGKLPPRVTSRLAVFVPSQVTKPEQHVEFGRADELLRATREYWTARLAPAMRIEVPDPLVVNAIKASQVHCLMAARSEANRARIAPWIASVAYGPLESEGHSVIRGMDALGHEEFARKSLDFFVHRYNKEGFLTTGYTLMGTGWHLWTLAEHYRLTRDKEWLKSVAPEVARVCAWVVAQRAKTMKTPGGVRPPEYGLMPPGVMADWNAFAYYYCLNGYYCAGLRDAAAVLAEIGVPEAAGWAQTAKEFEQDILRAFAWTRARMPVYRLRDGTSVPGYPSQVYGPGPTASFFPGEDANRSWCYDVELGSHHLVPFGILPPAARETAWMMDHMEDVQFLAEGWFDFPAALSAKDPFNRGGFAKVQPYYCRNAEIYAQRDDVKPFVRSYLNTMPSLLNLENLAMQEHFGGVAAWNKTHETGYFLHQSRLMMVMERGDDLWLTPLVTDQWYKDGAVLAAAQAPTRFGPVGFRLVSAVAQGHIDVTIDPPTRAAPRQIVVRLRHPDGKPIQQAAVDGQPTQDFDPALQVVRVSPAGKRIALRVTF